MGLVALSLRSGITRDRIIKPWSLSGVDDAQTHASHTALRRVGAHLSVWPG
jgi:hypothetical protein